MRKTLLRLEKNREPECSFESSEMHCSIPSLVDLFIDEISAARFDWTMSRKVIGRRFNNRRWMDSDWRSVQRDFYTSPVELEDRADVTAQGWWPGTIEMEMLS
jgi:hypothetical protein